MNMIFWIKRVLVYCVGIFSVALGVSLSILSDLGVSPVNSVPYVLSLITKIDMGVCVTGVFCLFILLQVVILKKDFKIVNVLQIVCSTLFGMFVNVTNGAVSSVLPKPTNYAGSLVLLACSIFFVALGVLLYLSPRIMFLPGEGVMNAVVQKTGCKLSNAKMGFDISVVAIAIVLSLIFLKEVQGVREGTVVAAACVGLAMKPIEKLIKKPITKFLFGSVIPK